MAHSYQPSIEAIDAEIAGGFRLLLFHPDLERRYEDDMTARNQSQLLIASIIGVVFYDMFLINDWNMVRDVFHTAVVLRLVVFTPIALAGIVLIIRGSYPLKVLEMIAGLLSVLTVGFVMVLYGLTDSIYRPNYQYGPLMIMVFTVVVQRIRFRYCLPTAAAMIGVQLVATISSRALDAITFQAICTICLTVSILVLFAAYGFEHERRRSYLLSVRSQLLNEQLDRSAKIDPLTGLWNRRHLKAILHAAWTQAETAPTPVAAILLDIDHFKLFNDTCGHLEGDTCLQRVGACVREALGRDGGVAVRFGGEEFLIFLAGVNAAAARDVADAVVRAIHREAIPHPALGAGSIVTASLGVATGRAPDVSSAVLVHEADLALYEAKRAGRDRIHATEVGETVRDLALASGCERAIWSKSAKQALL